jgi:hypothetical protein
MNLIKTISEIKFTNTFKNKKEDWKHNNIYFIFLFHPKKHRT